MALHAPSYGPVLGLTTVNSVRLMAGIDDSTATTPKLNSGFLRFKKTSDSKWSTAKKFRFNHNFYWTGVIELTDLMADTEYSYQLGYDPKDSGLEPAAADWKKIPVHSFKTQASSPKSVHFCFGSCLRQDDEDDRVGKVLHNVSALHAERPLDFMLWMGDQIYNDKLLFLTANNSSRDDFFKVYKHFLNNPYVKPVLANIPNYMVMDDHEIENSFTDGAADYANSGFFSSKTKNERLINGILAMYCYQLSHGPIYSSVADPDQPGVAFIKGQADNQVPVRHYAAVTLGDVGLFLLDCRKERSKHKAQLISQTQENALLTFLSDPHYRVRFVVSSVTFLADDDSSKKRADNWKGAADQRNRIISHLTTNQIPNVFFLSGDVHSHFAARLEINKKPSSIYQLVSGSLFWPTSFIIDKIRWFRDDVMFKEPVFGCDKKIVLSNPLSDIDTDFFASNGIGYVAVEENEVLFRILNEKGTTMIEARLPLQ